MTVQVTGWGKFAGKYLIDSVNHKIGRRGATTALRMHKALPGGTFTTATPAQVKTQKKAGKSVQDFAAVNNADAISGPNSNPVSAETATTPNL